MDMLESCMLCPRNCKVNRHKSVGFCGASDRVKLAYYSLHQWEEPVISGENGSGTVFFSNCNLRCLFCQNKKISTDRNSYGKEISNEKLKEIFLKLQDLGAHNINLVTPTHYVPQIIDVLKDVKNKDLKIPVVYNTSSYENVSTIESLNGLVDIYLADLKYFDEELGTKYSKCNDYFKCASLAIGAMYKQTGKFQIKDNLLVSGLVVRVLVLPGHIDDSKRIIKYLYDTYKDNIIISIMNQYTPVCKIDDFLNLNRKLTDEEYDEVIDYACSLGIDNAFVQEGETQSESFIPDFDSSII
jgi:putative pyruvate formate lyase activating enzyme